MVCHHPELVSAIAECVGTIGTAKDLHKIKNMKDAMLILRQYWVELELSINGRKAVDVYTVTQKMVAVGSVAVSCAAVLREIVSEQERDSLLLKSAGAAGGK